MTKTNTYTGGTDLANGTILLGIDNALPTAGTLTLGGTLDLGSTNAANGFDQVVARLTGSGTVINNNGLDRSLTVSDPSGETFSGSLLGNLNFTKDGA